MKLRFLLISIFFGLVLIPLLLFRAWPHSVVLENELDEVHERHLLIARNLAAALERYHRDLGSTFDLLLSDIESFENAEDVGEILDNLSFRHVCIAEAASGRVISQIAGDLAPCPKVIPDALLSELKTLPQVGKIGFGPVRQAPDGQNVMHLVKLFDDKIAVGAIYTSYFIELGSAVSFGVRGHAAIVDHEGNVLSHPLESWIADRKNISQVSAVQRMLEGKTGVDTFFSPALKDDMIAGYATVKGAGWGVMIPQPMSELYEKADDARHSAFIVMVLGVLGALLVAGWFSVLIARPIEWISEKARQVSDGNLDVPMTGKSSSRLMPTEMRDMQSDFQNMVENLREARQTQTTIISSMSHELRTPLNAIIGFSEVMKSQQLGPLSDTYREYSDHIHDAGNSLLKNINDLLDLQRLESGKMTWEDEQFSLNSVLKYADAMCGHAVRAKGIELVWPSSEVGVDLFTDKARLCQCITNLITNSAKFTASGGTITVSTDLTTKGDLEICIADTGIGIAPENLARIRRPFEQIGDDDPFRRNDGLGLGLSIVQGILSNIGGRLSLESTVDVGTQATITIPSSRLRDSDAKHLGAA